MKPYQMLFDADIRAAMKTGARLLTDFPRSRARLTGLLMEQPAALKRREAMEKKGVQVPPLLIVSTTRMCNLRCAGCYAHARADGGGEAGCVVDAGRDGGAMRVEDASRAEGATHAGDALRSGDASRGQAASASCGGSAAFLPTRGQIDALLAQAVAAGCAAVLLAGGEPLLGRDWLEAVAARPELLGLVFTNGTLLDDAWAAWFDGNRNMVPLISIEGTDAQTDARRGPGVASRARQAMARLRGRKVPFGLAITATAQNVAGITQAGFLREYVELGCRLAVYTEYVPVGEGEDAHLSLSDADRARLQAFCQPDAGDRVLRIVFPGDETAYGGCLAAGRGFAHIGADGALEPCPFAEMSDRNAFRGGLVEALRSPLLERIRAESAMLHEGGAGCALRNKREILCGM